MILASGQTSGRILELVCPAGSMRALTAAFEAGADCVYVGLKGQTNARNFAGLNFDEKTLAQATQYAHQLGKKVYVAINTYARQRHLDVWYRAIDMAHDAGADALIMADITLLDYARKQYPGLRRHLSVQGAATNPEALRFYQEQYGIVRAVLPRVLSIEQVEQLMEHSPVEIELFGFGSLCVMLEGHCALSSYAAGEAPNLQGVCSPAKAVRWKTTHEGLESRLNGVLVDRFGESESAGYPTICKGRFRVGEDMYYAIEEPTSLNVLALLPKILQLGISAIKIEGRQRSPAYVAQVTQVWRQAIDRCRQAPGSYRVLPLWKNELDKVAEGNQHTFGAYSRPWK
ncbi:MAG: U32 family peptidase [Proteobacteria bacterium]|nr:U32 family peptidase [Pseudomonadota bacterium]MDE3207779.1 U32 family peptidase [Pseudomonadota bacterium]